MRLKDETMKHMKNIGLGFFFVLFTILLGSCAGARATPKGPGQSSPDQSSLGDYARKVRKDPGTAKAKPKVFDNDNIPMNDKLSIVGQPPAADAADKSSAADSKDAATPAVPADEEKAKKQAAWKA